jgi:cysteine synthase A
MLLQDLPPLLARRQALVDGGTGITEGEVLEGHVIHPGGYRQHPLVELSRLSRSLPGRVLLKLDYLNPEFSKKDRAARGIIEEAETSGSLHPGQTVVELTSGNMGTGLAIVSAVKGYRFVAVMSRGNSPERAQMMRAFGAEVVLVDQAPGSPLGQVSGEDLKLAEVRAQEITQERGAFRADQFARATPG